RIGVCIYLLLTLIGLITTFLKVFKIKNLWFLFRVNSQIAFLLLILFSLVNWDYSITKYNLENAPSLDLNYLINLSDNNAVLLNAYRKTGVLSEKDSNKIDYKYNNYIKRVDQRNWQEYTYANFQLKSTTKTANY
ncbi:MAG: DUF4173 domain-containing protein, partial [Oceanihabitans sp.]|nr:DUF4173 domain-containing protein [Oceanihabitans sp.]